jgi:hypothetical protein
MLLDEDAPVHMAKDAKSKRTDGQQELRMDHEPLAGRAVAGSRVSISAQT